MNYWLLKSEPSDYSIDDLIRDKITRWDGIRNHQARNFIRDKMQSGDKVLIYHSSCKQVGVVGCAEVISNAYPDPAQFDQNNKYFDHKSSRDAPKWFAIDIEFNSKAEHILPLSQMKGAEQLAHFPLFKQSRLSVIPVSAAEWEYITVILFPKSQM